MDILRNWINKILDWARRKGIITSGGIVLSIAALIFFGLFAVILGLNNTDSVRQNLSPFLTAELFKSNLTYQLKLEIARTETEREQGLMFRGSLDENSGMLFVFNESKPQTFWMLNTYIPLDVIFLDSNFKVVKIYKNTKPNQTTELYPSTVPVQYAIETNAGWSDKVGLQVGDEIDIPELI
jgi:uncharacterized membrane protein (UPF0127 family)